MYGWRLRIGLMVPASNTTMESEFWRMAPEGVSIHVARMLLGKVTEEDLIEMENNVELAARELKTAKVDVIAFGCTTGSLVKGKGYDREISSKITSLTGVPSITTSTAVLEAFNIFNIKNLIVVTPYTQDLNRREVEFFESYNVRVKKIVGLELIENLEIGYKEPYVPYRMVKELKDEMSGVDGVFISCTNFRTIEVIDLLEKELKLPVLSSNQATFYAVLKMGGVDCSSVKGYGSIFQK